MSITTGAGTMGNRAESLTGRWGTGLSLSRVNGNLSRFAGSTGSMHVDFTRRRPDMPPHSGLGDFYIYDGNGNPLIAMRDAEIQVEEGPRAGAWRTVQTFAAKGIDSVSGLAFLVATDHSGDDATSLGIIFGVSDTSGLAAWNEAMAWGVKNGVK